MDIEPNLAQTVLQTPIKKTNKSPKRKSNHKPPRTASHDFQLFKKTQSSRNVTSAKVLQPSASNETGLNGSRPDSMSAYKKKTPPQNFGNTKLWEPIMSSKMNSRYNRAALSTPKLAKYDRRETATDVNISNQRENMTNITITDHDLFDTE